MKSDNYEEWIDRYYAGAATPEEIIILKSERLINEDDELYATALQSERKIILPLEFEDFIDKLQAPKVVLMPSRIHWLKRSLVAAAIIAAIITAYIFWPQQKPINTLANLPAKHQSINPDSSKIINITPPQAEITTGIVKQKQPNKIAVRQASPKQKHEKKISHLVKETQPDTDAWLVVVNGKPVTDEKEAIAIASESMSIFSNNLSKTIEDLKQISQIKIKL